MRFCIYCMFGLLVISCTNTHDDIPPISYSVQGGSSEPMKHGYEITFYENGQIKSIVQYQDNQVNGWAQFWYPNGQLSHAGYLDSAFDKSSFSLRDELYREKLLTGLVQDTVDQPTYDNDSITGHHQMVFVGEGEYWPFKWTETGEVLNSIRVKSNGEIDTSSVE